LTDTAKAVMHRARTVHQTVFDDSPAPPEVGKVLTRRAAAGTRLGAIQDQGDSGRRPRLTGTRAGQAGHGESQHDVAAERECGRRPGQGRPRCAPARMSTVPAATGASNARARMPVRRRGPVGVTSTTWLAGSSRVNAAAAANSART